MNSVPYQDDGNGSGEYPIPVAKGGEDGMCLNWFPYAFVVEE